MRARLAVLLAAVACSAAPPHAGPPVGGLVFDDELLRGLAREPWLDAPGTSEQYAPMFVGTSARDVVLGRQRAARPRAPIALRELGIAQARRIAEALGARRVELLAWPSQDWNGQPNWVFARWRAAGGSAWVWLTQQHWRASWPQGRGEKPLLPEQLDPASARAELFGDALAVKDLYHQPRFGNCVYAVRASGAIALAWPHPRERVAREAELTAAGAYDAYCVNPPARFHDRPVAFVVGIDGDRVAWPAELDWVPAPRRQPPAVNIGLQAVWPPEVDAQRYADDVRIFAGEAEARPGVRFGKRGAFQPDHDLERVVDYLEERYGKLGIRTQRQRFTWRGIAQSNLVAKIDGTGGGGSPVVMADHIDAACEEDTFDATGERVTTPGADDNATATAALLAAAVVLRDARPRRDIWLVHLTGEEFPADSLGARRFIAELMRTRRDVRAVVITDFIGWHHPGRPAFQISPTSVPGSERIAAFAIDAARRLAPELVPLYAPRDHTRNSVFQTDLVWFEYHGIPGVLFNEDMDYSRPETSSPHNHRSTDVVANVDAPFAFAVARVAIETVLRIANE